MSLQCLECVYGSILLLPVFNVPSEIVLHEESWNTPWEPLERFWSTVRRVYQRVAYIMCIYIYKLKMTEKALRRDAKQWSVPIRKSKNLVLRVLKLCAPSPGPPISGAKGRARIMEHCLNTLVQALLSGTTRILQLVMRNKCLRPSTTPPEVLKSKVIFSQHA